jgi:hypothetical protein
MLIADARNKVCREVLRSHSIDGAASVARSTEKIAPEEVFSRAPSAADLHQLLAVGGQRSAYLLMRNRARRMPRCRDLRSRLVLRR